MKPAFYDTDCLSCFIVINDTSILEELFDCIYLPYEVYDEFNRPNTQNLKNRVDKLIEKAFVKILDFDTDSEEYFHFMELSSEYFLSMLKWNRWLSEKDFTSYLHKNK